MAPHLTTFSTNTFYSNNNKRNKLNGGNSASISNVSLNNNNSLTRDRDEKRFFTQSPARKRTYQDKSHSGFYSPNGFYTGNSRKLSPYNSRTSPKKRNDLSRPISSASNFNSKKRKLNFTGENKINTKDDSKLQMKKSRSSSEEAYRKHNNSNDSSPNSSLNRLFKSDQSNGQSSTSRNPFATNSNNDSVNQLFNENLINDKVHIRKPVLIDEVRNEDKENSINKLDYQDNRLTSRLNRSNESLDTFSKQSDISYPAYYPRYSNRMTNDDDDKFHSTQKSSNSCYGNHSSIINSGQYPVALRNLGNTCYMNAILQPLFIIPVLMAKIRDSFERIMKTDPLLFNKFEMTRSLMHLFKQYKLQGATQSNDDEDLGKCLAAFKEVVSVHSPEFATTGQHDAVEFLDSVINGIDDEFDLVKNMKPKIPNPIDDVFKLELAEATACSTCGLKSNVVKTKSHCLILSLPEERSMEDSQNWSLQHILKNYFKPEKRESKCEKCGNKERNRFLNVIKSPKALILLLGRYSASGEKRHEQIKVPLGITLPNVNTKSSAKTDPDQPSTSSSSKEPTSNPQDSQFELSGVICHHGSCLTGGHYICYVHDRLNDLWYQCDDENIMQTNFERVQEGSKNSGYGFFYLNKKYL